MASVLSNSLAMLVARLLVPLFSFGINIGVARLFGSQVLGQYVELVALMLVAQALAGGGLSLLLTREVAARPDERDALLQYANWVGLGTGLLASAIFLIYARFMLAADMQLAAILLALSVLPSAWISVQEGLFMGLHQHSRVTLVALVEGLVKLGLSGAVLLLGGGLVGLCASLSAGRLAGFALGRWLARRAGASRSFARPDAGIGKFARAAIPFTVLMTLSILYFRQDVLVVGALRGEAETGFYGVAMMLYALTLMVPNSFMAAVYPRIAAAFATARGAHHAATVFTSKLLTAAGAVLALGLMAVAPLLVELFFGVEYTQSVATVILLAAVIPVHCINAVLGQAMQAAHLQTEMTAVVAVAVVCNLALNLWLVSVMGIEGAAMSLLLTSAVSTLAFAWIYHSRSSAFRVGPRMVLMVLVVAVPVALPLLSPASERLPAVVWGLLLLVIGARVSGLVGAKELKLVGQSLGLGGPRAERPGA